MRTFEPPEPGDIVYCRFPLAGIPDPGPKPRPALVLQVGSVDGEVFVCVCYGTSQKINRLYAGEFLVSSQDGAAYAVSGLAYPTKFDLGRSIELPFNDTWFDVPPRAPFGQTPKLGLLHPSLMRRARAAFMAAKRG